MQIEFTKEELRAIYQLCCSCQIRLYSPEYFVLKSIADKIIQAGVVSNLELNDQNRGQVDEVRNG